MKRKNEQTYTSEEIQQNEKWQREALEMLKMNDGEKHEATANIESEEERVTKLLALSCDQIRSEEMLNILKQLLDYRILLSECIFEEAPHNIPLNTKRLKQSLKEGFVAFKRCKDVVSKEEKKKLFGKPSCVKTTGTTTFVVVD